MIRVKGIINNKTGRKLAVFYDNKAASICNYKGGSVHGYIASVRTPAKLSVKEYIK